jgi:hypothetical protein
MQHFKNWICFQPQWKDGEAPIQLGALERVNLDHLSYFGFPNDPLFRNIQQWTEFRDSVMRMCHSSNHITSKNISKLLWSPKDRVYNSKLLLVHTTSHMNPNHKLSVHTETSSSFSSSSSTFSTSLLLCLVRHTFSWLCVCLRCQQQWFCPQWGYIFLIVMPIIALETSKISLDFYS